MKAKTLSAWSVLFSCILLSGCATTSYVNSNPARNNQMNFDQDSSLCRAVAIGQVAMPGVEQMQNTVQPYAPRSGTMRDQYGNRYRYQENYNPIAAAQSNMAMAQQGFANAAAGLANLGARMEAQGARESIFNHCLRQQGWVQTTKEPFVRTVQGYTAGQGAVALRAVGKKVSAEVKRSKAR